MELSSLAVPSGRERVIQAAYALFTRHGTRAVGVDSIIAAARVAKMTLYRNFASKDELIVAVLHRREQLWTHHWLQAAIRQPATDPVGQLLAIFRVFGEWFSQADFEGCLFLRTMLEISDRSDPVRRASTAHLANVRNLVRSLAEAAGVEDPGTFTSQWHILMTGAILAAEQGDRRAAERARALGILLLRQHGLTPPTCDNDDMARRADADPWGRSNEWMATA